jgi:hypothetical protein
MLVSGQYYPPLDVKAEESIHWTTEARERMERVPAFVRGIARTAVLRYALEKGHSVVSSTVIDQVMALFMPQKTAAVAEAVAETLALQTLQASGTVTYICEVCGYVAKGTGPVQCPVWGSAGGRFVRIDPQMVEAMATAEGGIEAEETFDGVKLKWTLEARDELKRVTVAYMRRRAKARIEKSARVRKLSTITRDFVRPIVSETLIEAEAIGAAPATGGARGGKSQPGAADVPSMAQASVTPTVQLGDCAWTEAAIARLNRVPEGFMRDITRKKIEDYASQHRQTTITLEVAEAGIEVGRQLMAEMIAGYSKATPEDKNSHES